jgi:hypothetical protein
MKPQTIGRVFGIGVRLAGRAVAKGLEGPRQPANGFNGSAADIPGASTAKASSAKSIGQATGRASRGVVKGVGGFLRPFGRVGGIVWLEVTGVFFFLPVIVFAPMIWRTRMSWAQGPDHRTFAASIFVVVIFLYLGISSFWRARRRSKT